MKKIVPFLLVSLGCGGQVDRGANKDDPRCSTTCADQTGTKAATACGGMSGGCAIAAGGAILPGTSAMGYGAMGYGAMGYGAMGYGAMGYGAMGYGAMGYGAMGYGAMGYGAMGYGAMPSTQVVGGRAGTSASITGGVTALVTGSGGGSAMAGAAAMPAFGGDAGRGFTDAGHAAGVQVRATAGQSGTETAGRSGSTAGHAGTNKGSSGVAGSIAFRSERAHCGALECNAWSTSTGFANCCYASATDNGCSTSSSSGCASFPASLLHCDSGGDCVTESSTLNRMCIFEVAGRRAFCGGAVPNTTTQIQLCEPGEVCFVGTCQPTTLDGRLPPQYWACLP